MQKFICFEFLSGYEITIPQKENLYSTLFPNNWMSKFDLIKNWKKKKNLNPLKIGSDILH